MTKLTRNQTAVLRVIARAERETGAAVERVRIVREAVIESRYLTTTIVSLMERGLIVNARQGYAVYATTDAGRTTAASL